MAAQPQQQMKCDSLNNNPMSRMSRLPTYSELDNKQDLRSHPQQQQQQQFFYGTQPQAASVPVQQVQYYVPPVQQNCMVVQRPDYSGPNDFLVLAQLTMVWCGLLNLTALMLGIPAVVFAAMSNHMHRTGNNRAAKRYSNLAIGLVLATIIYTLVWAVIITGIAVAASGFGIYGRPCYYYRSYSC